MPISFPGATKRSIFVDEKVAGTAGGSSTAGAWRTRDLNTTLINQLNLVLAGNQITLPQGDYYISAFAQTFNANRHKVRIFDATNNLELLVGTSEYSPGQGNISRVIGTISLSGEIDIELQHQVGLTGAGQGWGVASNYPPTPEIYSMVELQQ